MLEVENETGRMCERATDEEEEESKSRERRGRGSIYLSRRACVLLGGGGRRDPGLGLISDFTTYSKYSQSVYSQYSIVQHVLVITGGGAEATATQTEKVRLIRVQLQLQLVVSGIGVFVYIYSSIGEWITTKTYCTGLCTGED